MCDRIELAPIPGSVAEARRWTTAAARRAGCNVEVDTVVLLVSELVTNVVLHARTACELVLRPSLHADCRKGQGKATGPPSLSRNRPVTELSPGDGVSAPRRRTAEHRGLCRDDGEGLHDLLQAALHHHAWQQRVRPPPTPVHTSCDAPLTPGTRRGPSCIAALLHSGQTETSQQHSVMPCTPPAAWADRAAPAACCCRLTSQGPCMQVWAAPVPREADRQVHPAGQATAAPARPWRRHLHPQARFISDTWGP